MPKRKNNKRLLAVGERVRFIRESNGMTQQQVADELGINRTTYTKYETGISEINYENAHQLCMLFNIDYNVLFDVTKEVYYNYRSKLIESE